MEKVSTLASAARCGQFVGFAKLEKLVDVLAALEIRESLGLPYILALDSLGVALAADLRKNARGLNTLGEASKNREIILVWSLGYFYINALNHEAIMVTQLLIHGNSRSPIPYSL